MSTPTRLDQLLYAWLAEPDEAKFELAFAQYYEVAYAAVVRYLARRASSLQLDYEQIAVDALLKFFSKVGRDRRQAAEAVADALPQIQPLDFGPLHVRHVRRWTADVDSFRTSSMAFVVWQAGESGSPDWKVEVQRLAQKISPLQRQGWQVLHPLAASAADMLPRESGVPAEPCVPAQSAVVAEPLVRADPAAVAEPADPAAVAEPPVRAGPTDVADEAEGPQDCAPLRQFAITFNARAKEHDTWVCAVEQQHPGATRFVGDTSTVIEALPALRVPTNGYLFDTAQSLYLDECKARGRQKRGGVGVLQVSASESIDPLHPLGMITVEEDSAHDDEVHSREPTVTMTITSDVAGMQTLVDPTSERIGEDFCQQFYAYLRRPLDDAEEAYRMAAQRGSAKAEKKRLESLRNKIDRMFTVLTLRVEGQTQDEIALTLDISRNQVKYIVELVRESYERFTTACAHASARPSQAGGISHVQQ